MIDAIPKATMRDFLASLRKTLIDQLVEERKRAATVRGNKIGESFVNGRIELLERLNIFVAKSQKEEIFDMKELKVEIGETGSLDELMQNEHGGIIEPAIQEIAKRLKVNTFERIDGRQDVLKGITWNHFSGRVYRMLDAAKLTYDIVPIKRDKKFYLGRVTEEKAKELREKRQARKMGRRAIQN